MSHDVGVNATGVIVMFNTNTDVNIDKEITL